MLLIFFLGGVLFSLLWEANSRYIYPYILLSMPLSAIGWAGIFSKAIASIQNTMAKNTKKICRK